MLKSAIVLLLAAMASSAAEDAWAKVRAVKSGAEIRVVKRGAVEPVLAKMDELTDENLVVVVKNAQVAIPRNQIERIDARPAKTGKRVVQQTTSSGPEVTKGADRSTRPNSDHPSSSYGSSVNFVSKPDFETVYRRAPGAPKK
jgi:hypothetical protein